MVERSKPSGMIRVLLVLVLAALSQSLNVNEKISATLAEVTESTKGVASSASYVKSQAEFDLVAAKSSISDKYNKLKVSVEEQREDDPLYSSITSNQQFPKTQANGKLQSTLAAHGVKDVLVQEINNMKNSFIPREHIIQHVASHFPRKTSEEWNDIVISALGMGGNLASEVAKK